MKKIFTQNTEQENEHNSFKIQSFTYFIPAPKQFSQAYREKRFDKLFYDFINRGYEILDVKTEHCSSESGSGFWIIFLVRATNKAAEELDFDSDDLNNSEFNQVDGQDTEFEIIPE